MMEYQMFGQKETDIILMLQLMSCYPDIFPFTILPNGCDNAFQVWQMVSNKDNWSRWIHSSGKSDPPPDFYCDEFSLMMDVMRVDDHAYKNKKGKIVNPNMMHERKMFHELQQSNIFDALSPNAQIHINGITDLPTDDDHNYSFYYKNFSRVVQKHIDSIPLYRKNHPNLRIIFLIFDESSAYFLSSVPKKDLQNDRNAWGIPHYHFADKRFLETFLNKGIDYLIWMTPYKLLECEGKDFVMPQICVFDLSEKEHPMFDYDIERMISAER